MFPHASRENETVLLVEDDPILSQTIASELGFVGFDIKVSSGEDAVELARTCNPMIILLDVSLQQTDAVEIIQELSEIGVGCPIQLMSGCRPEMLDRVKRVGERRGISMLPVLHKPFAIADLQVIVNEAARTTTLQGQRRVCSDRSFADSQIDLGAALDEGWVEVWYQPKYDIKTLSVMGAECLCRIRHRNQGVMGPSAFLSGASSDDLRRLTEFVLQRACEDWVQFKDAGLGLRLAINIPCSLLTTMPLAKLLRAWTPRSPDWPGLLLEVTEEQALRDVDAAHEIATQLAIYGIDFAIDDFGTGYSSLSRLREIPFKEIKLDRTLVDGCSGDEVRAALCRTIIDLSHTLGAITVSEGVERVDDLVFLRSIGCDVAQGFLLSRPMTCEALSALIRAGERLTLGREMRLAA